MSLEDTPVQKLHFISIFCTENRLEKEKRTNEKSHPWLALGGLIRSSLRDMWWRFNFKWRNWFQPTFLTLNPFHVSQWYTYTCWYDIYPFMVKQHELSKANTYKYIPAARSAHVSRTMHRIPHTARHIINWMEFHHLSLMSVCKRERVLERMDLVPDYYVLATVFFFLHFFRFLTFI